MAERVISTLVCCSNFTHGFTLCVSMKGDVYSFGGYELEHDLQPVCLPNIVSSLKEIKYVGCGFNHMICLDYNGDIFSFGCNSSGELGIPNLSTFIYIPQKVDIPPVKQISCGERFTFCLSEDNELFSFGNNEFGQLGMGNYSVYTAPQKLESLKDIDFVECGGSHIICKSKKNEIFAWGYNGEGQLGTGNTNNQNSPVCCSNWPSNVVDVKCGDYHTIVLTSNQEVYSCGNNEYNQLGRKYDVIYSKSVKQINPLSEIIRIGCGASHSMCIDIHNNFFVFGSNEYGQLGLDCKLIEHNTVIQHPTLSNVVDISSGGNHTFIKTLSNEIYAFGCNEFSQLSIDTKYENQLKPIRVLKDNEDIWYSHSSKSRAKSARK